MNWIQTLRCVGVALAAALTLLGCAQEAGPAVVLPAAQTSLADDLTLGGVSVCEGTYYDELPQDLRDQRVKTKVIPASDQESVWYDVAVYASDSLAVYVIQDRPGAASQEDGMVCAVRVTDPSVVTARGLKIGDPKKRAVRLYGEENPVKLQLTFQLRIDCENDLVSALTLCNRFWTLEEIR